MFIVKYILITPWCPANRVEWYRITILSLHTSGMANTASSLPGFETILNNNESSNIYFLLVLWPFWLLFYCWATYFELGTNIYLGSKNWLDILSVFLWMSQENVYLWVFLLNYLQYFIYVACFGKNFCTSLPMFTSIF